MRSCGECTLCCKHERIRELDKPRHVTCKNCAAGGCATYASRPQACAEFRCAWLNDDLPEPFRPDLVHAYAYIDGISARVMVEPEYPDSWRSNDGAAMVKALSLQGLHVFVVVGDQINFVCGAGRARPDQICMTWVL